MHEITLLPILGFLLITLLAYVVLPQPKKGYAVLLGSLVGIALTSILSLLCFVGFSLLTYVFGRFASPSKRGLSLGIFILLGSLVLYAFNLTDTWKLWRSPIWGIFSGTLVIGWSYFLFNALSYLFDIERGIIHPETSLPALMRYLLFFPMLFAGPMHRKNILDEQFKQVHISAYSIQQGMRLMLWGLFKNFVLAKRLFLLFQSLQSSELSGPFILLQGMVFFFYIYVSFSSFVDFFQGLAKLFSIQMTDNFHKRVYWSASRHQFWQGWHISLNAWFRDYFFYRLMKQKFWRNKIQLALFITFLLIALWHDASIAFLVWGTLNAWWILLEKRFRVSEYLLRNNTTKALGRMYHIGISSFIALVFTENSLGHLLKQFMGSWAWPALNIEEQGFNILVIVFCFLGMDYINRKAGEMRIEDYIHQLPLWPRNLLYAALMLVLLVFGEFSSGINNYYFKF